jgi:hypothetical protein
VLISRQLEVLRRRTLVERRTRCLRESLLKKERSLCRQLESVMAPSLNDHENSYQEVDFDIVTQDGVVGSAESLLKMHSTNAVAFLKVQLLLLACGANGTLFIICCRL